MNIFFLFFIFVNIKLIVYTDIVKKIKEFNDDQKKLILNIWKVDCSHLEIYDAKHQCPVCKKKFKRIPDDETFRKLSMIFNATDTAWAKIFVTDRSSVTKVRNRINPKPKINVWNDERYKEENKFYKFQDKKPVEDFLSLLKNFPRSTENQLLKVAEISKEYLLVVLKNDSYLDSQYKYIKKSIENGHAEYLFCVKCKVRKNKNKFDILEKEYIYAKICSYCAELNFKQFNIYLERNKRSGSS